MFEDTWIEYVFQELLQEFIAMAETTKEEKSEFLYNCSMMFKDSSEKLSELSFQDEEEEDELFYEP